MYRFDLSGKTAIITGGAEGFGQEFATTLAEQGAEIAIFDEQYELACITAKEVHKKTGKKVMAYNCNVGKEYQVKKAVAEVVAEFGRIDILVNNAGKLTYGPIEKYTIEQWNTIIETDLTGVWLVSREVVLQSMRKQGKGRIVNISSVAGYLGSPAGCPSYHAAKAGCMGLTRAQAVEYAQWGILVNSIAPGTLVNGGMASRSKTACDPDTHTKGRCPLKRAGVYGELSGAVIYFASDACTFTTGQVLSIDGGTSITL